MGKCFMMSKRFNKCNPSDFGLVEVDSQTAINPQDQSVWIKVNLYDFGWGKENGFYRYPFLCFDELLNLVLYALNDDDVYGAGAVILDSFGDELLYQCEKTAVDPTKKNDFKRMIEVFHLDNPINRSPTIHKSYKQVQEDYARWKRLAEIAHH